MPNIPVLISEAEQKPQTRFVDFIDNLFIFRLEPNCPHRSVFICRVRDLRELGELSPHWDNLRKEVMTRYGGIISSYQETLAELDKITGMTALNTSFDFGAFILTYTRHKCVGLFTQTHLVLKKPCNLCPWFVLCKCKNILWGLSAPWFSI